MLNKETANQLLSELRKYESIYRQNPSPKNKRALSIHENLCVKKFSYIVKFGAKKYKNYSNYQDLLQEGYIALVSALKTYNEEKGDIFWWCHKYIDTKICRKANKHFVVDVPLAKAKRLDMKKVFTEDNSKYETQDYTTDSNPELIYEEKEWYILLDLAIISLDDQHKNTIKSYFNNEKNISKIQMKNSILKMRKYFSKY